jgi:hypothetical protein
MLLEGIAIFSNDPVPVRIMGQAIGTIHSFISRSYTPSHWYDGSASATSLPGQFLFSWH